MAEQTPREKRDLVLSENEYTYMQDVTKGSVKTYTGPCVVTPSNQEVPIQYDQRTHSFVQVELMEQAKRKCLVVPEGFYCVLTNPSKSRQTPEKGKPSVSAELEIGKKIIIAGNTDFALWPGQEADLIRGHHLRSNQYLLVKVYNEEEARKSWGTAIMKPAAVVIDPTGKTPEEIEKLKKEAADKAKSQHASAQPPKDLTMGKLLIIQGIDVSFYIPPTGVTVVAEGETDGKPNFVREALTLERLEYAILVDEDGNKRYERGPTVVFPKPTEKFKESKNDDGTISKKFRAIELNPIQGIHLRVIANYKDESGKEHLAGEEMFVTGKDTAFFYPREELAVVKYDGKTKSFAVAIPSGEGRYVMNRMTGVIRIEEGPAMLLPDPREFVIAQRPLSEVQCDLWYPENKEVKEFNQKLLSMASSLPTTRSAPTDQDVARRLRSSKGGEVLNSAYLSASSNYIADSSQVSKEQDSMGEEFSRSASFTTPRSITLNTKLHGVPMIQVWTGYAVMVVSKKGDRRVELGPKTVLMEFDETLEVLTLSTGKPKNTDHLLKTVYLRVENNQVTDIINAETSDHVRVECRLSYRLNFEGDPLKWFSTENYVKYLCDHIRSVVKGKVKKIKVEEFYANSTDLLRQMILEGGPKGQDGMLFSNGMHVNDVEVLGVTISDANIRQLLDNSQTDVVRSNIEVASIRRQLDVTKQKENVAREEATLKTETVRQQNGLAVEVSNSNLERVAAEQKNKQQELNERAATAHEEEDLRNFAWDQNLAREKRTQDQRLSLDQATQNLQLAALEAEVKAVVERFKAAGEGFSDAIVALGDKETMIKVAEALNMQRSIGGESFSEALGKVFSHIPALSGLAGKVTAALPNGSSDASKKVPEATRA